MHSKQTFSAVAVFAALVSLSACSLKQPGALSGADLTTLAGMDQNTPVTCQFERRWNGGQKEFSKNWYFMRQKDRTETRDTDSQQGEIWERDPNGRLSLTRVYYGEKVAVEYSEGDLKASDKVPSWSSVWSIIDSSRLGKEVKLIGKDTRNGLVVEHYTGKDRNGVVSEVDWIPSLQLPLQTSKISPGGASTGVTMTTCQTSIHSPVKPTTSAALTGYRVIDFSDLGDMESDPQIKRITALSGEEHHH